MGADYFRVYELRHAESDDRTLTVPYLTRKRLSDVLALSLVIRPREYGVSMTDVSKTEPPLITALERLLKALRNRNDPQSGLQKAMRWLRRIMMVLNVGYAALLTLLLALLEWRAETHWFLSFALFIPPQMWLLPIGLFAPLTFLIQPRWCYLYLGCVVLVLFVYMDPQFAGGSTPTGRTITLLTNNRGQDNKQSPSDYVAAKNPDLVVYQEAGKEAQYAKAYPDHYVRGVNEFTLISRFPIRQIELLPLRGLNNRPIVMRAVVDWEGTDLVIYNLHLSSPRDELQPMAAGGLLAAFFGGRGGYGESLRNKSAAFWEHQRALATEIADRAKAETAPTLIAGDFNVPNHGMIYGRFRKDFAEAFEEAGGGYGLNFPGFTRNPLTGFGPWLRLDNIFCNAQLRPVECEAEPHRRSQHRSMVATFELKQ
jgi:endonuclease/exonuclease/phosphatase (EEP) superfamily protein YafD